MEVSLNPQENPLRQLFHQVVFDCYEMRLGMHDREISTYVADLLTEFSRAENVYRIRDAQGKPVQAVEEMMAAADPVHGIAASFGEEREFRKHIGDYTLFFAGMYPDSVRRARLGHGESYFELVRAGKESYYIVSQFDLFEYAEEAPFFARLSGSFETCIDGLNLVRGELGRQSRHLGQPSGILTEDWLHI
jgi:hypothetical protein